MENTSDWLSRLLEMMPVKGTLDYRCFLGAPWRIDFAASERGEIPYHVILGGSAVLEDPEGSQTQVLPGNTKDNTTLKGFLDRIERQYGKARRIWLMDRGVPTDRKSTRLNSSHRSLYRMPSSA